MEKIKCEHRADENHQIVGAASIIAKYERDEEIEKFRKENNLEIAFSGYPDLQTKKFLLDYYKQHQTLPNFARKTWNVNQSGFINIEKKN